MCSVKKISRAFLISGSRVLMPPISCLQQISRRVCLFQAGSWHRAAAAAAFTHTHTRRGFPGLFTAAAVVDGDDLLEKQNPGCT